MPSVWSHEEWVNKWRWGGKRRLRVYCGELCLGLWLSVQRSICCYRGLSPHYLTCESPAECSAEHLRHITRASLSLQEQRGPLRWHRSRRQQHQNFPQLPSSQTMQLIFCTNKPMTHILTWRDTLHYCTYELLRQIHRLAIMWLTWITEVKYLRDLRLFYTA